MRKAQKLDIACPNNECRAFDKNGLFNVVRNGTQSNGTQKYKCTDCGRNFVRTIGTPFFHKHLSKDEIKNICKHLAEKNSYRSIARVTEHHLDTIRSVADAVGKHCEKYNQYFVKELRLTPVEVDEMWSFVKKKKRTA
jgi:transposase-like protein